MKPRTHLRSRGAALVDYGILVGLVSIVGIVSIAKVGSQMAGSYETAAAAVENPSSAPASETPAGPPPIPRSDLTQIMLINGDASGATIAPWVGNFVIQEGGGIPYFQSEAGASGRAAQSVSIPEASWEEVDAGLLTANVAWKQRSWARDDDGGVEIVYRDADGAELARRISLITTASDGDNDYTYRSVEAPVPEQTRTIAVAMVGERRAGTNLDAYFYDLDLEVSRASDHLAPGQIRNPDASQHARFWTMTGAMGVRRVGSTPDLGLSFYGGDDVVSSSMSQVVDVPQAHLANAGAGTLNVSLDWMQSSFANDDLGQVSLTFLDDAGTELGSQSSSNISAPSGVWTAQTLSAVAPAGTTAVRVTATSTRIGGKSNDGYFDNFEIFWN